MRHFALSFAFAASLAASLLAVGCLGHPEDWEEEAEDALAKAYAAHIATLNALGVNTEETPAQDRNGKELPEGCNPLGAPPFYEGRVSVGQVYEIYMAGVDYTGEGYEDTVYAGFQDGWPTERCSGRKRRCYLYKAFHRNPQGFCGNGNPRGFYGNTQCFHDLLPYPSKI